MIINLSKHDIVDRSKNTLLETNNIEFLGLKELPLSYINTQDSRRSAKVVINEKYLESSKTKVIPYSSFSSDDIYLFNENNEIIDNVNFKRIGSEYFFETKNQIEYNPLRFNISLDIKKKLEYRNDRIYNIKIATYGEDDNLTLSKKLISVFGDKNKFGNCPSNIIVNNGSREEHNMMEQDPNECDFVFVESTDGILLKNYPSETVDDFIERMTNNHTNVWLSCDQYLDRIIDSEIEAANANTAASYQLTLTDNILYDNNTYNIISNPLRIFDQEKGFAETVKDVYNHQYLCEAILIVHRIGYGYIIITPSWFFNKLEETDKMIYETLVQVYLNSYVTTKSFGMWITDESVDYLAYHKKKYNRCHNIVTINDILMNTNIEVTDQYSITNVNISSKYVSFIGINNKNELMFVKVGGEDTPKKKNGEVSYYTTKHSIINYNDEGIYIIETPMETEITSTETGVYLTIKPVYSTSKKLRVDEEQTFKITNFATQYNIFVDKGSKFISNTFYVIPRTEMPDMSWTHIGVLSFELSNDVTANDSRIIGGGLPEGQPDDFDMLDIGHIYGRPYRLGNTIIIKLPKKASNFDKRIRSELDKHIAAGDEYVIHYNNE